MCIDYNKIISSCDALINTYASYVEPNFDQRQDLCQTLRIKIWEALQNKYDSSLGSVYDFAYGVIRLESRKYKLDAHKYRQRYFDDTMEHYEDINIFKAIISTAYYEFENFVNIFASCLTYKQKIVFDIVCDNFENEDILYKSSGKIHCPSIQQAVNLDQQEYYYIYQQLRTKLFKFAKSMSMLKGVSSADARV